MLQARSLRRQQNASPGSIVQMQQIIRAVRRWCESLPSLNGPLRHPFVSSSGDANGLSGVRIGNKTLGMTCACHAKVTHCTSMHLSTGAAFHMSRVALHGPSGTSQQGIPLTASPSSLPYVLLWGVGSACRTLATIQEQSAFLRRL